MTTEINQKYSILMFSDQFSLDGSDLPTRKEQNDLWNGEKAPKAKAGRTGWIFCRFRDQRIAIK